MFSQNIECLPISHQKGRCGSKWGGRCNKKLVSSAIYCNVKNGLCHDTQGERNSQRVDAYDWEPAACHGSFYYLWCIKACI